MEEVGKWIGRRNERKGIGLLAEVRIWIGRRNEGKGRRKERKGMGSWEE